MKAAVMNKPGDLHLEDRPLPVIDNGETLIKVKYIGICGSDLHLLHGQIPSAIYPLIPGHEFVGEVVMSTGEGAERFSPGDIVAAQELITCGVCESCAKGEDNVCRQLKIIGIHTDGGFAEYVKVKTRKTYALPKDIDLQIASLIEPLAVAVHDVRRSMLKVGETALVVGGGPIGLLIAIVARAAGARKIVISEVSDIRIAFAKKLGFEAINPTEKGFDEKLRELTDGRGFDVSFETAGVKTAIGTCLDHTKNTGTVVVIAVPSELPVVDTNKIFTKELTLVGVRVHSQYSFMGAVDLIVSGVLNNELKELISKVYPLDEIVQAFNDAQFNKENFKILIRLDQ